MCSIKKPTNNNPDMSKDSQKTFLLHSKIRSTEGDNFVMALICFLFENYVLFLYEMEQFKTVGDRFSQHCRKDVNY